MPPKLLPPPRLPPKLREPEELRPEEKLLLPEELRLTDELRLPEVLLLPPKPLWLPPKLWPPDAPKLWEVLPLPGRNDVPPLGRYVLPGCSVAGRAGFMGLGWRCGAGR